MTGVNRVHRVATAGGGKIVHCALRRYVSGVLHVRAPDTRGRHAAKAPSVRQIGPRFESSDKRAPPEMPFRSRLRQETGEYSGRARSSHGFDIASTLAVEFPRGSCYSPAGRSEASQRAR